jgi:serine-type D-Ala-D-Ala carboxypeptidase/endopeptidase (penicillin-binding protein 4)
LIKSYSMKRILPFALYFLPFALQAQTVSQKLQTAFTAFEKDEQLKHAISSLYVIDAKTGQVVFDKNAQIGLAPASTQKIITSVTAFELLGKEYRYKTEFFSFRKGLYVLENNGDPTFGSWRYKQTVDTIIFASILNRFKAKFKNSRIESWNIITQQKQSDKIPDGWIYQDIGNYYGSASRTLSWKENQTNIIFKPGEKEGDDAPIDTVLTPRWSWYWNNCKTGKKGSGDNAYVYFVPGERKSVVKGTVPAGEKTFTISATDYKPEFTFLLSFLEYTEKSDLFTGEVEFHEFPASSAYSLSAMKDALYTHYSPSLDSIIYWFNKKSINLYGEALIKTFAYEKQGFGSTDSGVAIVKKFWKGKGLDEDELNIYDGSGLSPMNRVTTHAQVEILKYAKTKDWYPYFLKSLPEYNGITMKSGTIGDVKGFCGYHKAKDGREYIFSFLVNNYSGKTSGVVGKMYKVLDELK